MSSAPAKTVRVRVHKISGYTDPETGRLGKQIELVEVRKRPVQTAATGTTGAEEVRVALGIASQVLGQLQTAGLIGFQRELVLPKMTLFLSEEEVDSFGIHFEVNEDYDLIIQDGKLSLKRVLD